MYHVPLVPRDADREETVFRIEQAFGKLNQVSNEIFDKIASKITEIHQKAVGIDERTAIVERKIAKLKESENVVTIILPTRLPPASDDLLPTTSTSLFRINTTTEHLANSEELPEYKRADDHELRPCQPIDFTKELNKVDKFFLTSQVMKEYEQKGWEKYKKRLLTGLRELPTSLDDMDIAELFFAGTSIPAYQGVTGDFLAEHLDTEGSSTRRSGRNEEEMLQQKIHEQLLEDTALGNGLFVGGEEEDNHPLAFRMDRRAESELVVEMPESLPNLKGHALNFNLRNLSVEDELLITNDDVSIVEEEEEKPPITFSLPEPPPITSKMQVQMGGSSDPLDPPPPPPSALQPPAPPPPPPPPPPAPTSTPTAPFSPAKSIGDGRSDLMAAIRAAGGASNAKLNKIEEKKRKGKYDGLLESSALSTSTLGTKTTNGGGDLMSALSRALDARRKAINGKNDRPSTSSTTPKPQSSIPAPPRFSDDEWE